MKKALPLTVLATFFVQPTFASSQQDSHGFLEDSHLNLLLKNAMINRNDKDDGIQTRREWGQAFIGTYRSGFTQGSVGFGLDAIGQYAVRLDGGRAHSGAGGIDYFCPRQ